MCARQAAASARAKFRLRRMSFAAGGGILGRNEVTVTNHKEILGGTKPTSEACARKVPKAAKHRLPQDCRGRRRLLSTEGANGHALALFELFSWLDGWDIHPSSQIILQADLGTVGVQFIHSYDFYFYVFLIASSVLPSRQTGVRGQQMR